MHCIYKKKLHIVHYVINFLFFSLKHAYREAINYIPYNDICINIVFKFYGPFILNLHYMYLLCSVNDFCKSHLSGILVTPISEHVMQFSTIIGKKERSTKNARNVLKWKT